MKLIFTACLMFLSMFQAPELQAQEAWEMRPQEKQNLASPKEKAIYSFMEVFPTARAIRYPKLGKTEGQWVEDHFEFPDAPGLSDIFMAKNFEVNGMIREAMAFKIQPDVATNLIFTHVPAGRKLKLLLALPDFTAKKEKIPSVQFEAWIGGKQIFTTEIQTKGWRQESVDLTLPYLLERSYVVSFKVYSVAKEETILLFQPFIE